MYIFANHFEEFNFTNPSLVKSNHLKILFQKLTTFLSLHFEINAMFPVTSADMNFMLKHCQVHCIIQIPTSTNRPIRGKTYSFNLSNRASNCVLKMRTYSPLFSSHSCNISAQSVESAKKTIQPISIRMCVSSSSTCSR